MTSNYSSSTQPCAVQPTHSAQYDRVLHSPKGGRYSFTLEGRDGAHVLVNGTLLLDNRDTGEAMMTSTDLDLAPGNHHIQLRYHDQNGEATLRLCVGESAATSNLLEISQSGSKATIL